MLLTRTLITIILFILMDVRQSSASNNFISGIMYKIVENEAISSNTSNWFKIKSNVYCSAFCLRDPSCTGFQFGDVVNENVTTISCNLLYDNVSLLTREPMPGISVYSLEREQTESTAQIPGSTNVVPGSTTAVPGSTTAVPGSTTAVPGSTTAVPGSTTLPPHGPCSVDAAFTLDYNIVIITGAWMHIYNSSAMLLVGPGQSIPVQTYLPGWSGTVDAAYMDSTKTVLYMIAGTEVKSYRLSDKMLQSTETTDQHFSSFSVVPAVIDAVIYYSDNMVLINSDVVYTANGSVPLSTQGIENVFDAVNSPPPTGVTGVTSSWTIVAPLFFAGELMYIYQPNFQDTQGLWFPYGTLKCSM